MKVKPSSKVAVVNGMKEADALSLSSLSTKEKMPVIMVDNKTENINEKLKEWKIDKIFAIGGENSISKNFLEKLNAKTKKRIAGETRYETSLEIARQSYTNAIA